MDKKEKNAIMKWTMFVSFIILLVGGLNYLFMGLLEFDIFGEIFGQNTIAGRVIFSIFGTAAIILAATVIYKTFYGKDNKQTTPAKTTKTQTKTA